MPRAAQLATQGRTYQQIADELCYANRGTVHHIVHDALARDRKDAVENYQQLELGPSGRAAGRAVGPSDGRRSGGRP